jgi:hypothetical protein
MKLKNHTQKIVFDEARGTMKHVFDDRIVAVCDFKSGVITTVCDSEDVDKFSFMENEMTIGDHKAFLWGIAQSAAILNKQSINKDLKTPMWQLTLGDLLDIVQKTKPSEPSKVEDYTSARYVHHIGGIAKLFGCSKTTVYKYRKQGWIEPSIKQIGHTIVCDAPLALKLFGERE